MKLTTPLCCLGVALLLSSCIGVPLPGPFGSPLQVPVQPPLGGLYTEVKAPMMANLDKSPSTATKIGRHTTKFIRIPFYPILSVAFDDASIKAAAQDGGITKIYYADYELMMVLSVYGELTTIVYGE